MSLPSLTSLLATGVVTVGLALVTAAPAQAAPACDDAVAGALHTVHDATGDPGGLVHEAEETYCTVAP